MTLSHHHRSRQKRRLSTCSRHPTAETTTDLCASCLRERLHGIQNQLAATSSAAAQLRRSCSGGHHPSSVSTSEPSRNSCEVRTGRDRHCQKENPHPNGLPFTSKALHLQYLEDEEEAGESKTMKEFIDLELGKNKSSRSLWAAASVFTSQLRQWTTKQRKKNEQSGYGFLQIEGPKSRHIREAIAEVAEYAFGRRSCDADPRFSLDIGHLSLSDPRFSFDEPRASWDGYLIGKTDPRNTQMVVLDNNDDKVAVAEERWRDNLGECAQTGDCFGGSVDLQRQRRSFCRSGSVRRMSWVNSCEVKSFPSKELMDSNRSSLKDFVLKSVQYGNKDDDAVANGGSQKGFSQKKSSWQWKKVLSLSGFRPRRKDKQLVMEDKGAKTNAGEARNGMLRNVSDRYESHDGEGSTGHGGVRDDEGFAGHGSLVECLQKLRMLDAGGEGDGEDGGSKCFVGNGTLAESLQKLRIIAKGDKNEKKKCKYNEQNVEALQKLRMVGSGGSPAEPLQKPRTMVINVSSNYIAPVCEKIMKSNGYVGSRKSCDGYIDGMCKKLNAPSNGYIGARKSCDGCIHWTGTREMNSDYYSKGRKEKLRMVGSAGSPAEPFEKPRRMVLDISSNAGSPIREKLMKSNGYVGTRKSCDGYIDVVCEKLMPSDRDVGARISCDESISIHRMGTREMKENRSKGRKEKVLVQNGSLRYSPNKMTPLRSHDSS